jgi:hypothetical protein
LASIADTALSAAVVPDDCSSQAVPDTVSAAFSPPTPAESGMSEMGRRSARTATVKREDNVLRYLCMIDPL